MATMLVLIMVSTVQNLQILLQSDGLTMGKLLNWYAIPPEHGKRLERLAQERAREHKQGEQQREREKQASR